MPFPLLPLLSGLGIGAASGIVMSPMSVATNKLLPVNPAAQANLIQARYLEMIDDKKYQEEMKAYALNEDNRELMLDSSRTILGVQEAISLFRRGLLAEGQEQNRAQLGTYLSHIGIATDLHELFIKSADVLATPQDLVSFLVREVLTPELREQLELDAEFPEAAIPQFHRIGIPAELARNIWAAHWELPSIQQLTLAMHRYGPENRDRWQQEVTDMGLSPDKVETTTQDISQLLKFADVGPAYRQQVLSTLYRDAGQIQLRWLIRFRFINYEEAVYRHQRQGLPLPIARQIAKVVFCVQSITDWKQAIKAGVSTWPDIEQEMAEWQITETEIKKIVKLKVAPDALEEIGDERQDAKQIILGALELGDITRAAAKADLQGLGYDADQASFIIETYTAKIKQAAEKEARRTGLTKGEIKKGYRESVISAQDAIKQLVALGMTKEAAATVIDIEGAAIGR